MTKEQWIEKLTSYTDLELVYFITDSGEKLFPNSIDDDTCFGLWHIIMIPEDYLGMSVLDLIEEIKKETLDGDLVATRTTKDHMYQPIEFRLSKDGNALQITIKESEGDIISETIENSFSWGKCLKSKISWRIKNS